MRIAAVVTLFHPGKETLQNISSYAGLVEKIYAFDNTEAACEMARELKAHNKIAYFHDGQNEGIAKRLNTAAQIAIGEGFDWLLLMDQDSYFKPTMITDYESCFKAYQSKHNIGMFGVNFEQDQLPKSPSCDPIFSDDLITSGTLLNLSIFNAIGDFDENLFIDGVDHDYTIKTLLAGYKIVQFKNIQLTHAIGQTVKRASIKTLYLLKKEKIIHSPLRCYYIYRNNLYLQKKYKGIYVEKLERINITSRAVIERSMFYGRNLWLLVHYIIAAKRDFVRNKMGRYSG